MGVLMYTIPVGIKHSTWCIKKNTQLGVGIKHSTWLALSSSIIVHKEYTYSNFGSKNF